ncbi:MAG TPA: prolyl oligopeptidase family serine peptidase [Solirubrobacteraceae bacterium]|nr:prolyl oligopeptidase family serine peptidase [Solirubrobacteraceae bacterium]
MRRLAVLLALLVAPTAQAASLYDGPGPRPGPDLLYAPPFDAPQLANDGIWQAPPILVSGASAYRRGEFLYQDYLFDDHGARGARDPRDPRFGDDTFSAPYGTYTYPTDEKYAENAADLVELRIRPLEDATAFRLTYNTLVDPEVTATTIALGDSPAPLPLPHGANASAPASHFLTVHGTTADLRLAGTDAVVTPAPSVSVSVERQQVEVIVPRAAWDPGRSVVRVAAGTGLWDAAGGKYLVPSAQSSATAAGGAFGDASPAAIFNVAFRYEVRDPAAPAPGEEPRPQIQRPDQPFTGPRWWRDQAQGDALRTGDLSPFFASVDFGKLRDGVEDDMPGAAKGTPVDGPMNRILASHFQPGQGQDFDRECGSATNCEGELLSRLQPYAIYVPRKPMPARGYGMTLLLHSLGANYNQFTGSNNQSQLGERAEGSIVITPAGRGPDGWYWGVAGADTFEVWADVARRYRLAPEWTAISGYSMGGYGTYKFATQFPDLFAAANPVVGPPSLGISATGEDSTGGDQTNTGFMLPSVRHIPFLMWVGSNDELVPISGTTRHAQRFDDLGYRYVFDVFAPADHFALAVKDNYEAAAEFLGSARVDRDPAHVTYVVNPKMDFPEAGTVADHAYWLSGMKVRSAEGEAPRAFVDAVSEGFGVTDPEPGATTRGGGALTGGGPVPPALAYVEQAKAWGSAGTAPVADRLRVTATNLSEVTVNVRRARVTCDVDLEVDSDGPLLVRLDGCGRREAFGGASVAAGGRPAAACRAANGFVRAFARPRGRRVRIEAAQVDPGRFDVDVFRQSRGRRVIGELRVARFAGRRGSFRWDGRGRKVGDGVYIVRFTKRLRGGRVDVRRVVLERRRGKWRRLPDYYRRVSCGRLSSFKLTRPVFGGTTRRPLGIAFRVSTRSRVGVRVLRGKKVVKRFRATTRAARRTHRLRLVPRGLRRGTYRVVLDVRPQRGKRLRATLTSRRL